MFSKPKEKPREFKKNRWYFIWVLRGTRGWPLGGPSYWEHRAAWPRPMCSLYRARAIMIFETKKKAEDWLYKKHISKGRDVSFVQPAKKKIWIDRKGEVFYPGGMPACYTIN